MARLRYNLVSIFLLAFGLVAFTVLGVALAAPRVFDGFDWRLGFVLGAVVAPTDAIAATSVARRVGLPSRIVDILEGESLINDASALLMLQFATAILVRNEVPSVSSGTLVFLWLIVGGVGLGLLVAGIIDRVERQINDGPIEIALSILVPYAVYLAAEKNTRRVYSPWSPADCSCLAGVRVFSPLPPGSRPGRFGRRILF